MYRPFYLFVGRRYTGVKRKNHFISFISMTSMLGIALGVTVLITVLSVMNGFRKEIRAQMLSVTPHITLRGMQGPLANWQSLLEEIKALPQVSGAAPYIVSQGILADSGYVQPAIVRGIIPNMLSNVYPLRENIIAGEFEDLTPKSFGVMLGRELANNLGIWVGDKVTLMVPEATVSPAGVTPRLKRLTVIAIFDTGTHFDNRHAFMHLDDAAKLFKVKNGISGIQIRINDELEAKNISNALNIKYEYKYWISNWTDDFSNFFEAIKMEKTVMWCILFLIVTVAVFNLVSSLVMLVTDKRANIAIMRTMGATKGTVMAIFVVQGAIIGTIGTLVGLICGLSLAYYITDIVEVIQRIFNIKFISEDVYFIGFVPSNIESLDVIVICVFSFIMSLLATIYPAYRAAKIHPAEALRYE